MAAAVPLAVSLGGSLIGKMTGGPGKAEKSLMNEQIATARQARGQGSTLFNAGMPLLNQASSYYRALLSGNRGALTQALAPEIGAITDVYRGAEKGLERSGVRGAQRDMAEAEIGRERAGRIAGLVPALRPQAAQSLGQLGQFATGQGTATTSGAGSLYGSILSGQRDDRRHADEQGSAFGAGLGGLVADVMKNQGTKGKGPPILPPGVTIPTGPYG